MNQKIRAGIDYIGITTPFYCNNGKGIFVLQKRSQKCRDERGVWDFGGGQLEFGQNPTESVLREVLEEYGCKGVIQKQLPFFTALREHEGQKTHWLAIPFLIKIEIEKVKISDPFSIDEIGFFDLKTLPQPLHTGAQYVLKNYNNHFKKYKIVS